MISRIVDAQFLLPINESTLDKSPDNIQLHEDAETFVTSQDDELRKLFEIYCSFGEPMNTKYLKSSKMLKLLRDCGLIKGLSRISPNVPRQAQQITTTDMDLAFTQINFKG